MAKWTVANKVADFKKIGERFHIDQVIARIIRNRDIITDEEIDDYLNGTVEDLLDPKGLKDLVKAVQLMLQTIQEEKKIRVIGDYDADGICASYILYRSIKECGGNVDTVIPHRILDGYGINDSMIVDAHNEGVDMIITCDNGISARDVFAHAKEFGMSCIITDHHQIPFEETENGKIYILPEVDAIVNPHQEDCHYAFSNICGAYVAYQFAKELLEEKFGINKKEELLEELLEVAGIATVCDIMPLKSENRIIVKACLQSLKNARNIGLRALIDVNEIQADKISSYSIGFVIGPCLNASGRLDTAELGLDLLKTMNYDEAIKKATHIKELNTNRKELTEQGVDAVMEELNSGNYDKDQVLVIYLPDTHESIAGIIAGRVREKTGKPTFILTDGEEGVKGSARSVEAYNLYEEMTRCQELFTKFGGHKMAAGFSMKKENIDIFRRQINENCSLTEDDLEEKILIDVPMPTAYVTKELIQQLDILEPFGTENRKPVFAERNIRVLFYKAMKNSRDMIRMQGLNEQGQKIQMLMFRNGAELLEKQPEIIDILYYPQMNSYHGTEEIQFVLQGYRIKE